MKTKQFSPKQIACTLNEYDQGKNVNEITQSHGVSKTTFYKWRKRYGGMSYDELKKLKSLEVENRKLKHIYTGLNSDLQLVREIIEKKLYD